MRKEQATKAMEAEIFVREKDGEAEICIMDGTHSEEEVGFGVDNHQFGIMSG